jgi:hypothetical protein
LINPDGIYPHFFHQLSIDNPGFVRIRPPIILVILANGNRTVADAFYDIRLAVYDQLVMAVAEFFDVNPAPARRGGVNLRLGSRTG